MVDYVDAAYIVRLQSSFLAKKTYDVHLAKFVFLSSPYVERSPNRALRGDRLIIDADFPIGVNKIGQRLGRAFDDVGRPLVIPTRGATGAMREVVGVERKMIMDNGTHLGDVQSASGQIGGYEYVATAGAKLIQRALAVVLLHTAVVDLCDETLLTQVATDALRTLAMGYEDDGGCTFDITKQARQGIEFILIGRGHEERRRALVFRFRQEIEPAACLIDEGRHVDSRRG